MSASGFEYREERTPLFIILMVRQEAKKMLKQKPLVTDDSSAPRCKSSESFIYVAPQSRQWSFMYLWGCIELLKTGWSSTSKADRGRITELSKSIPRTKVDTPLSDRLMRSAYICGQKGVSHQLTLFTFKRPLNRIVFHVKYQTSKGVDNAPWADFRSELLGIYTRQRRRCVASLHEKPIT